MTPLKSTVLLAALACATWAHAADAPAPYPTKPITFVVPGPAGGGLDILARALADEMGKSLGQAIVVDNKPGAGGMLGTQTVSKAAPDGYTLLVAHSGPILTAPFIFPKVPYDPKRDLSFISQLCTGQLVIAVNAAKVPATNIKEFIAWAGKNKGSVTYGSYGIGTAGHLISAYLGQSYSLDMVHAPYKGENPMVQDLVGGQLTWGIASVGTLGPHLESGRVRALAVVGEHRAVDLPKVPTMAEAGFPEREYKPIGWIAMLGPANLPAPIQQRLEKEARAAVQTSSMKARFQAFGMEAMGTTSAQFRQDFDATLPVTERMVRVSGAKAE